MSRIGKLPVEIPSGVEVTMDGSKIVFKKGSVQKELDTKNSVIVKIENNQIVFAPKGEDRQSQAFWGTYRSISSNIITGITKGFEKKLEINGVGYRAAIKGNTLELLLGFSHPITYNIPKDISITVEKNIISVKGNDKQLVGQVAADIRSFRPPEPYKGKGVKYIDETILRKAGKTGK